MVFPLEAIELIKNSERGRVNQVAQLSGNCLEKPMGVMNATCISLQQIQEGNVDLFHFKMKKQTETGQKQYKIDCEQSYIFRQITRAKWQ